MTTPRIGCSWWIGNIQELPASEKIEVTHDENEGSDGSSVLLILVVSFFLLNFLDLVVFLCCSVDFFSYFWNFFSVSCQWKTVVLAGLVVFLKGCSGWSNCFSLFSLVANWWWGKSCPRISLSMKDCGAAGRAAKSPLQILFWKTFEGFFFFNLQISLGGILSVFLYFIFSSSPPCWKTLGRVVRCRLREIPADVLCTSFKDFFPRVFWFVSLCSALDSLLETSWMCERHGLGRLEFMKTWSRERQRVGSSRGGWKDDWVGSGACLKDEG